MPSSRWERLRVGNPLVSGPIVVALAAASVAANTRFDAPPRYDGAAYAVLARSLASGLGYREINDPARPRHTHFPPGYPFVLALVFRAVGPSAPAAHALSVACTSLAALATWAWLRRLYPPRPAFLLGAALAVNWTWGRLGGAIQSEPLYLALSGAAIVAATGRPGRGPARGWIVGVLLAACVLTRHVGACLAVAVVADLVLRRRPGRAAASALMMTACLAPWVAWLARSPRDSQASLFRAEGLVGLAGRQALFYARRVPDQVVGPVVEIATVYARRPRLGSLATAGAIAATAVVVGGWCRVMHTPRRRLAGLVPATTLPLLLVWPFTEAGRFLVPLVPFLLVGAVEGLVPLLRRVGVRRPRTRAAGLVLLASLPYAAYAIATRRAEAQERTHRSFDAACAWIAGEGRRPGPILADYPADVFWQTGRAALSPPGPDPEAIRRSIDRHEVAYLLVDEQPFTNAPADPLSRLVAEEPDRFRPAWGPRDGVSIYEVLRPEGPRGPR